MTSLKVKGHGEFSATEKMMARFGELKKTELVKMIADGYTGGGKSEHGIAHWRSFPKDTLVVIAANMFATNEERGRVPAPPPAPAAAPVVEQPAAAPPTAREEAPNGFVLKVQGADGWLRRDQPRRPGESAKYRVVLEVDKATVIKTRHQVELKLAEAATLLPSVPASIEVVQ